MFTSRFVRIGIVLATLITIVLGWLLIKLWYGDQNRTTSFQSPEPEKDIFSQQSPRLTETDVLPSKRTATERTSRYGKTTMSTVKKSDEAIFQNPLSRKLEDEEMTPAEISELVEQLVEEMEAPEEEIEVEANQLTTQKKTIMFDEIPVEVEPGKKYRITQWGVGTWNPRPRTPEEEKRFAELLQELLFENPSKERKREIQAELNVINAETSYPTKIVNVFWLPMPGQTGEPPDWEVIDINLTR